jgi:hypothetical protein
VIKVGEVYESNDPRDGPDQVVYRPGRPPVFGRRRVRVIHVWDPTMAVRPRRVCVENVRTGRHTEISEDRLLQGKHGGNGGSRGWTLVAE